MHGQGHHLLGPVSLLACFPSGDTAPINLELEREGEHCMSAVAALWNILLGFRMSGRSLTGVPGLEWCADPWMRCGCALYPPVVHRSEHSCESSCQICPIPENVDMVVSISGRDMALSVAPPLEGMQQAAGDAFALAVVTVDGENLFLVEMLRPSASNYTPDLIRARVNGELVTMQVLAGPLVAFNLVHSRGCWPFIPRTFSDTAMYPETHAVPPVWEASRKLKA